MILFGSGILGMIVALVLRARRPAIYADIGERTPTETQEHIA